MQCPEIDAIRYLDTSQVEFKGGLAVLMLGEALGSRLKLLSRFD